MSALPPPPGPPGPPEKMWSRIVSGDAKKDEAKEKSEAKGNDKPKLDGNVWPQRASGDISPDINEGYH